MRRLYVLIIPFLLIIPHLLPFHHAIPSRPMDNPPNQPPIADCGGNRTAFVGESTAFDGSQSHDPDKTIGWLSVEPLLSARRNLAISAFQGRVYAFGGGEIDPTKSWYVPTNHSDIYDPVTDSWSQGAPMPTARGLVSATNLDGRIYVIGGLKLWEDDPSLPRLSVDDVEVYDPINNTWKSKNPLPRAPNQGWAASATVGGTIIVVMNEGITYIYELATDTWMQKSSVPVNVGNHDIVGYADKVYLFGGINTPEGLSNQTWIYDPTKDSWTAGSPMPTARRRHAAAVFEDQIYVLGGSPVDFTPFDEVEVYDPITDTWLSEDSLPTPRLLLAATATEDELYAVGGQSHLYQPVDVNEVFSGRLTYLWDFGDGSPRGTSVKVTHVYLNPGIYDVVLTVTDAEGATDNDYCTVTVLQQNQPPIADANGPYEGFEGSPVEFKGSHTDSGFLDTHTYEWDFDYDGISFTPDATGPVVQRTWFDDYSKRIALKVTDDYGGWDIDDTKVLIKNVPPTANAGEDEEGYEVSTFTFDGHYTDPGTLDTHTYEWDFDYDGISFDIDATGQSVSQTWTDDFDGHIALKVTDDDGGEGIDTAHILVKNVPPTVKLAVLPMEVDISLRVAGEKWHDVSIELFEDGALVAEGLLTRYPGSPNNQMLNLVHISVNISREYSAIVRYTPEDDPINGQPNGANPCWIILRFTDGEEVWIHHTFNVQHSETYVWEVDLTAAILSHGLTFEATARDPGADVLMFHWDFGDGTDIANSYPNLNNTYPVEITDSVTHEFLGSGTYVVTLTVEDDDGGSCVATITIAIP